jgi:hypothetical protein
MKKPAIKIQKGDLEWNYRGESWSSDFGGSMVLKRYLEDNTYTVERFISGINLGRFTGLTIDESTEIINRWLEPSRDEPQLDEFISACETRRMARIL